jgi:predicted amidohydrolase
MKFAPTIAGNVEKIRERLLVAARKRADVVLFPECAVTGYGYNFAQLDPRELRDGLADVARAAADCRTHVLIGTPVFHRRKLFNCLVVFDRGGAPVHCYAKCQLTESDRVYFTPGNAVSLFEVDGVAATAVICHERRYPELVRLAAMAGAKILFHPNAGMDSLAVSRRKRGGRDGIAARAFENAIFYVFANSVGPQGDRKWSAGDSKIVSPDQRVLRLADNESEAVLVANLELAKATRVYARRSLERPRFLAPQWKAMLESVRRQASDNQMHRTADSLAGLA